MLHPQSGSIMFPKLADTEKAYTHAGTARHALHALDADTVFAAVENHPEGITGAEAEACLAP